MTSNSKRAFGAFFALSGFLAVAVAPALACEDHAEMATPTTQTAVITSATVTGAQAAPQAQLPTRSTQNAKTTDSAAPALMFEKPFRKWWTED